jgi:DNA end-binding protein Ku
MMAYTLRYTSELRNQSDYFRDIKPVEIGKESLELAESLIAKRSAVRAQDSALLWEKR